MERSILCAWRDLAVDQPFEQPFEIRDSIATIEALLPQVLVPA